MKHTITSGVTSNVAADAYSELRCDLERVFFCMFVGNI